MTDRAFVYVKQRKECLNCTRPIYANTFALAVGMGKDLDEFHLHWACVDTRDKNNILNVAAMAGFSSLKPADRDTVLHDRELGNNQASYTDAENKVLSPTLGGRGWLIRGDLKSKASVPPPFVAAIRSPEPRYGGPPLLPPNGTNAAPVQATLSALHTHSRSSSRPVTPQKTRKRKRERTPCDENSSPRTPSKNQKRVRVEGSTKHSPLTPSNTSQTEAPATPVPVGTLTRTRHSSTHVGGLKTAASSLALAMGDATRDDVGKPLCKPEYLPSSLTERELQLYKWCIGRERAQVSVGGPPVEQWSAITKDGKVVYRHCVTHEEHEDKPTVGGGGALQPNSSEYHHRVIGALVMTDKVANPRAPPTLVASTHRKFKSLKTRLDPCAQLRYFEYNEKACPPQRASDMVKFDVILCTHDDVLDAVSSTKSELAAVHFNRVVIDQGQLMTGAKLSMHALAFARLSARSRWALLETYQNPTSLFLRNLAVTLQILRPLQSERLSNETLARLAANQDRVAEDIIR
ncbi:hypothetical protein EXIGLDRAFT_722964 [Exidia glandulosa HHB12029]|uniref:PARP-type domain-containing protein n=1 Tax=Exidia glandulosa HHB12029 TaxID=1314781 RepID=A0A165F0S3_EXIGL|nr:hypothetical protein EXIGLDRAFT_722964 [Exidia glandulosa HHB12029]